VRILRVPGLALGRTGLAGRAVDFVLFLLGAVFHLLLEVRRGDTVVPLTDPPLLGPVSWLVAAGHGARVIHWTQDIYPEVAAAVNPGPLASLAGSLLTPWRDLAWRRSHGVVALGSDMAGLVARHGVAPDRITVIPNWAPAGVVEVPPAAVAARRGAWGLEGRFVVAYSGNLGRVHDLGPVLRLAEAVRADPRFIFLFIGGGARRAPLEAEAAALGLDHVRFLPPRPRSELSLSLATADLHLVTLLPGCEALVFPSKLYGIAAAGRPVLFIGPRDCELARLVRDRGLGLAFSREETGPMAAALRKLASDPAALAAAGRAAGTFSRESGLAAHGRARWEARLARPE
jgi:glycosyltransferase involved in cell wall biosynthesis